MNKTVYCNNCPCFAPTGELVCGITSYQLINGHERSGFYQDESDCPLEYIKLKDGLFFSPEVQDGDM